MKKKKDFTGQEATVDLRRKWRTSHSELFLPCCIIGHGWETESVVSMKRLSITQSFRAGIKQCRIKIRRRSRRSKIGIL